MGAKTTMEIAEWINSTSYRDLPSDVVDYSKILALSHLGMNIAGSTMEFGRLGMTYVRDHGGQPTAGVFGAGFRTSAELAALANGNSAHATELEDDSFPEGNYSCGHWPAVFALAEKLKVSGRDLIEALVVGYDVSSKLGGLAFLKAIERGRANFVACAVIGSAASAAKMLKLDVSQTASALSIAASQAIGIAKQTGTGAHVVEAGLAGRDGLCAAALAKLGFNGNTTVLEGPGGYSDLWADNPNFDLPLGGDFRIMQVGIKKYPCCYLQQRNIDGVLDLIAEHHIAWDDVASVEHDINHTVWLILNYLQPESAENSRFSIPHGTAACFFDKNVFLDSFSEAKVHDSRWHEARGKVKVNIHSEWPAGYFSFDSPVKITLKNGTVLEKMCVSHRGAPDKRFGVDDVMKKYLDCVDFAGNYSRSRADQIAELILSLEKVDDVSKLANLLTFPDKA